MNEDNNQNRDKSLAINREQFGREAEKYSVSKIHSNQEDLDFVISIINPKLNWECLDIATGAGHLAHKIAENVKTIIASDLTDQMLEQAQKLASEKKLTNITFENIDVHSISYQNNSFDLVSSRIAPHHFYDINLAISEMVRVTKTSGLIFIEDTVAPENNTASHLFNKIEILRDPSHKRDLSETEWKDVLVDNGCEILSVKKREKEWPLKWWTERMSSTKSNVIEILKLLEENYEKYKGIIRISLENPEYKNSENFNDKVSSWKLIPNNIYLLARKTN